MFQLDSTDRRIIYRRPTGRLMRPSDHMIATHGLGELGDIMDVFKNFGSGVVKFVTGGIYDPNKNRFYVPFSSGQMRNWGQGLTNTATLGLVKTDKFFNSQTMRTIGTIAGAAAATGVAYFGGQALMKNFAGTPVSDVPGAQGSPVFGPTAPPAGILSSTASLLPSMSTVKTGMEVLSLGAKVMGGGGVPQMQQQQQPGVVIMTGDNAQYAPPGYDPSQYMMQPGGGVMYPPPGGDMSSGPGMAFNPFGGGGGGIGPPGSEYVVDPATGQMVPSGDVGMSMGIKVAIVAAIGVGALFMFKK